jgi:hypothetical protein
MEGFILDFRRHGRRLSGGTPAASTPRRRDELAEVHKRCGGLRLEPRSIEVACGAEPRAASPRALGSAQSSRAA